MKGTATVKFRIAVDAEVQLPIETEKISLLHLQHQATIRTRAALVALEKAELGKNVRLVPDSDWENDATLSSVHIDSTVFLRNSPIPNNVEHWDTCPQCRAYRNDKTLPMPPCWEPEVP